jgi:hypothetical protein
VEFATLEWVHGLKHAGSARTDFAVCMTVGMLFTLRRVFLGIHRGFTAGASSYNSCDPVRQRQTD